MGLRFYLSGFAIFSGFACPPPVVARRSHTPARESARRQGSSSQSHAPNNATHQTMPTPDPCIICTLQHDFMRQQQCIPLTPALSDTLQVRTLIDAQKALNEEAPRIIYGRSNAMQELKVHEHAMNAAALTLLEKDPKLISFEGKIIRTGPLIMAAKEMVAAQGFNYAKSNGSRAAGLTGTLGGKRPAAESKLARQESASSKAPRKSSAVRTTEIEQLPRQIVDLEHKNELQRLHRQQLALRGQGEDLADAIILTERIAQTQACYQLLQLVTGGHLNSSAPRGKQKSEFSICSCAA